MAAALLVIHGREADAQPNAQKSEVRYDASNGAIKSGRLVAGKVHQLVLERLNPICYTYTANVSTTRATFDLKAAEALLGSAPTPAPESSRVVGEDTGDPKAAAANVTSAAGKLVRLAAALLDSVSAAFDSARSTLSDLQEIQKCEDPAKAQLLLDHWAADSADLRQRIYTLPKMIARLRDALAKARAQHPESSLLVVIDGLESSANTLAAKAARLSDEFARAARQLQSAARQATVESDFWTTRDDELVNVKIVQRSRRDGKTEETTFSVPTERRHRLRFSTGIIGSGVGSMHFDRINRPAQRDSGVTDSAQATDSTYSTWARVSGNGLDVVNPALLVSVSFGVSAIDLNASVGTTLRGVNGGTPSLEPLVGISLGTLDRFFLHLGAHLGRRETLLLLRPGEEADDVRFRAIPTNLTRGDVVGVEWVVRPFAGFSLRLN